jgi:hypothetical protein
MLHGDLKSTDAEIAPQQPVEPVSTEGKHNIFTLKSL